MIDYDIPIIEVQNIKKSTLCVFSDVEDYPLYDIEAEEKLNDVRKLRFNINARNPKCDYLINENILEYDGNEYIVITRTLNDDNDYQYYSIEAFGIEYILTSRYNGKLDFIGATVEEMMAKVLENSGFVFGSTNIVDKKRHLISEDTCVMDNLINMADVFDARLEFKTVTIENVVYRQVFLNGGTIDRGHYVEKGRNLISVSLEYNTEELVTRLTVLGQPDKVTGFPVNIIEKNPTGKSYVEDYSYYTDMGFALEDIQGKPQYTKELIVQNNDLIDADACYNFAVDEIKRLSKPIINCTCETRDLHQIKAYLVSKPIIGESVKIYDYDIGLEAEAVIVGTLKKHNDVDSSTFEISNVIVNNASFTKSYNDAKDMNKIFSNDGLLNGGSIYPGSIGSIQIGDAVINNAHINNLSADKINAGYIETDRLVANAIHAVNADISNAKIDSAKIGSLSADQITAGSISADRIQATVIEAINLYAGDAMINGAKIADASIGNSHISKLSADKLDAGTIDTSRVKITGSDNAIEIVDGQIMVNDTLDLLKPINRVTMGKYIKNQETGEIEYGLLIRGKDGKTVLFDGEGMHNAGITDGAIDDNKVSPDANINGSKLDIGSVITSINKDTGEEVIQSGKIYFDNKSLDVTFQEIKTKENELATNIASNTSNIAQNSTQIGLKVSQQSYDVDKVNNTKRFETIEGEIKVNSDAIKLKVSQTEMETYVGNKINKAVQSVDVFYAQSSSNTVAPTTGWVTVLPSWQDNMYIWTKSITTYVDTNTTPTETTPVCLTATNGTDGKGVVSIKEQYYKSISATQLIGGAWQDTAPTWESNRYIWTRSIITYTTGNPTITEPICATGSKGDKGDDGTSVKILGSYPTYEDLVAAHPSGNANGDGYIVQGDLYVWNGTKFENVGKIQGQDGIDGTNGVDGTDGVSIIWKGTFSSHPSNPQNGWAYYNSTDKRSYVFQSGAWYQMTIDGVDGVDGQNGLSIVWKGELKNPPANPQLNWCYKDTDNGIIYIWTGTAWEQMVVDGSNGQDGANGSDGLSVFITYHDSKTTPDLPTGNGTMGGWHTNATAAVVWMSQKVSKDVNTGTWGTPIKIKGVDGNDGSDGISITKVDVEYGISNSSIIPPTTWSTDTPEWRNGYYMWSRTKTYYSFGIPTTTQPVCISGQKGSDGTDAKNLSLSASRYVVAYNANNTLKDSSNITLTTTQQNDTTSIVWTTNPTVTLSGSGNTRTLSPTVFNNNNQITITATAGDLSDVVTIAKVIDGNNGSNGTTTYTWIKYSDYEDGYGCYDVPTIYTKYIGLAYNKTTATESNTPKDYMWSLIKGTDGVDGADGVDGSTTYTWIKYSDYSDGYGCYDTPNANTKYIGIATNKTTTTESTTPSDYVWSRFKGDNGVNGSNGLDAYTVILTNEAHSFVGGATAAIPSNTICSVIAYKGGTQISATIGTITGQVTGLTTSIHSNSTNSAYFKVTVANTMVTKNGVLDIPLTVDGKSFTKKFTYSLSLAGINGTDGKGIKSITEQYYLSTSKTTQSGGTWQDTYPNWVKGYYVWTRSKIIYRNPNGSESTEYTIPVCDSSWDVANEVDAKVESVKSTVAAIDLELDKVTTRVQTVESKTTTIEGTITNHENRIKTAEQKITDSAIISVVSGTIDQKITDGTAGILTDIATLEHDVATANNNASEAKTNATNALNQLSDLTLDSSLTPSEKQEVNRRWFEIQKEKSGIVKQSEVYGISKTNYETTYSALDTYLFGSGGILVALSSTSYNVDTIAFNNKFNDYYTARQVILDGVAQKSKEYADKVKQDVEKNISDTTAEIKQSYETAIKQEADKITNSVSQTYSTKGETTSLDATLRSLIEQTSKDITFNFEEATKYTKEVDGKLQETIDELKTYIRFDANGINLGEVGSPFTALLGNEKLAFMQNGTEIAYMSNNTMFITDVEIQNKLKIGRFSFEPRSNGNLSLKWR